MPKYFCEGLCHSFVRGRKRVNLKIPGSTDPANAEHVSDLVETHSLTAAICLMVKYLALYTFGSIENQKKTVCRKLEIGSDNTIVNWLNFC